jgi:hypothetical protein
MLPGCSHCGLACERNVHCFALRMARVSARQRITTAAAPGQNSEVPLYGMAACQRCLEEFDALLDTSTFSSPTWATAWRLFDVSRVANMLLAAGHSSASYPRSFNGVLSLSNCVCCTCCVPFFSCISYLPRQLCFLLGLHSD